MKKLSLFLCLVILAASCGAPKQTTETIDTKASKGNKVIIGISRNGIPDYKRENFAKCVHDAGAEVYFFPTYPENDSIVNLYLDRVDCLIIPGSATKDTVGRKYYDTRIIKAAINRKMPLLGICEGHQRINQVLGGTIGKVAEYYPKSKVQHKIVVDGKNIGAQSEAHSIKILKGSTLYKIYGTTELMVNTSHKWCTPKMSPQLKVIAVAPDGVVEAYEAENILGLQFHPEYMYGDMGLRKHLKVFEWFAEEGRKYRESNKKN